MSDADQRAFIESSRPHVLMITNHGIHGWDVLPGLPDTGGQNVFVNQFSAALAERGHRVTIANRGGYRHPRTGEERRGFVYRSDHERILYITDDRAVFVRKEDMHVQVGALASDLGRRLAAEGTMVDLVISHYWDGAAVAADFLADHGGTAPHYWIPHSLGTIKKTNMDPGTWEGLRIDDRIACERRLALKVDGVVSTSAAIGEALRSDYGVSSSLFLPPCVDAARFHPWQVPEGDPIWRTLAAGASCEPAALRRRKIIVEVSRTDRTKRKDILLRAFAKLRVACPEAFLAVTIDREAQPLADELMAIVREEGLGGHVAVLGSVWELLPALHALAAVYCTPSEMEGFGMAIQEAAACGVPAVASDKVPFAVEFLASCGGPGRPPGAFIVSAGDTSGFATSLERLLKDEALRRRMGEAAYRCTIPAFTWEVRTSELLAQMGF